jgi:hypothetical protein
MRPGAGGAPVVVKRRDVSRSTNVRTSLYIYPSELKLLGQNTGPIALFSLRIHKTLTSYIRFGFRELQHAHLNETKLVRKTKCYLGAYPDTVNQRQLQLQKLYVIGHWS